MSRYTTSSTTWLLGLTLALPGVACRPSPSRDRPNVILLTIESLRPDHLGCYGGPLPTTPSIDRLATESLVFDRALAVSSWTLTSHASLFTGFYPTAHRVTGPADRLGDDYVTLAELLRDDGYQTGGVASGPYLRTPHNLHQGFEHYDDSPSSVSAEGAHGAVTNEAMTAAMTEFIRSRDSTRPFFLFGYYWDPHYDYIPPPPFADRFVGPAYRQIDTAKYGLTTTVNRTTPQDQLAYVLSQYDGEIAWTDDHLGRLFRLLETEQLLDDTVVILTSDHGEQFFEHGMKGHKNSLFVEEIHVPLLVRLPGGHERGRRDQLVSHVDIVPTVLDLCGVSAPNPVHGVSLLAPPAADRAVFAELVTSFMIPGDGQAPKTVAKQWLAVHREHLKLMQIGSGRRVLFDTRQDPREFHDLAKTREAEFAALDQLLDDWQGEMRAAAANYRAGGSTSLTPEQLDELRSLGYVQ